MIDKTPTDNGREAGKWEEYKRRSGYYPVYYTIDFRCSVCHRFRFHNGEMRKKYKYCPNCGAKMEDVEGKNHDEYIIGSE